MRKMNGTYNGGLVFEVRDHRACIEKRLNVYKMKACLREGSYTIITTIYKIIIINKITLYNFTY